MDPIRPAMASNSSYKAGAPSADCDGCHLVPRAWSRLGLRLHWPLSFRGEPAGCGRGPQCAVPPTAALSDPPPTPPPAEPPPAAPRPQPPPPALPAPARQPPAADHHTLPASAPSDAAPARATIALKAAYGRPQLTLLVTAIIALSGGDPIARASGGVSQQKGLADCRNLLSRGHEARDRSESPARRGRTEPCDDC
jgi:hypothetical protein